MKGNIEFLSARIISDSKYEQDNIIKLISTNILRYKDISTQFKRHNGICLAAVEKDGHTLKYVRKQTPEICLAAVIQNGLALQNV